MGDFYLGGVNPPRLSHASAILESETRQASEVQINLKYERIDMTFRRLVPYTLIEYRL